MNGPRVLIAGIGNIFFGDDAFGVELARRLAGRAFPASVRVVDFGIRGVDLTYTLLDGWDVAILLDAVPRGGAPGTLYVIEPDCTPAGTPEPADLMLETHNLDPVRVLRLVAAMGGSLRRVLLVGCEPVPISAEDDIAPGLSPAVAAAVERAVELVESLVGQVLAGEGALKEA